MSKSTRALLSLVLMNLIYGANYPIAKGLMSTIVPPSGFVLLRDIGAVLLFALLAWKRVREVKKRDVATLALCAVFGIAINQLGFFHGLHLSSPVNAGIIMTMTPIIVIIMSALILKEKITGAKVLGVLLGAAGAIILILNSGKIDSITAMQGDIFLLINAISYGLFLVLVKPLMSKYDPLSVTFLLFIFGTLYVSPFGFSDLQTFDTSLLNTNAYWGIAYVVIGATFLTYLLNISALKDVNPSVVSATVYLQPLLAIFFSWLFGKYAAPEFGGGVDHLAAFTWVTAICAVLIFAGVYLVAWSDVKSKRIAVE